MGFVIRNSSGEAILAGAKALGPNISVLQAEAWALKEGISAVVSLNIPNLIIEGDNLAVINSVRDFWKIPWEIKNIIVDIRAKLTCFGSFQVHHCFQEANKVADLMASRGHSSIDLQLFYPPFDFRLASGLRGPPKFSFLIKKKN